jgi:hypothetical protein
MRRAAIAGVQGICQQRRLKKALYDAAERWSWFCVKCVLAMAAGDINV